MKKTPDKISHELWANSMHICGGVIRVKAQHNVSTRSGNDCVSEISCTGSCLVGLAPSLSSHQICLASWVLPRVFPGFFEVAKEEHNASIRSDIDRAI